MGLPLVVVEDAQRAGCELYDGRYVLVRPDQFVACAEEEPADPQAILRLRPAERIEGWRTRALRFWSACR